ncbi:MAG: addiction module toxin RelE [Gammaproteobacteria bacterium]|nr:MAG: addiction module toxin RelE [Gammaproteobacteria bacterium]
MAEVLVYETRRFAKALGKLNEATQKSVENEIEKVIADPGLGEQKKGDLNHLWVHKFKINNQEWLLGYNWNEEKITIHLLQLGSHENYYQKARHQRKGDLKKI